MALLGRRRDHRAVGGTGVFGSSTGTTGVYGQFTNGTGVYGASGPLYGVYGTSASNHAVLGVSTSGHGVVGYASAANYAGIVGVQNGSGALAGLFQGPVSVQSYLIASTPTANTHSITGYGNANGYGGVFGVATAVPNSVGIYGYAATAGTWAGVFNGAFIVYGGNKSAAVPHPDGTHRLLYCMESPEAWFEDFSEGALAAGVATVALDGDFAAVVDTSKLYIFLTPYVAGNALAVTARSATGFTVTEGGGGKSSGGFAYRVVAKRKDVASPRLAKVAPPSTTVPTPPKVMAPLTAPTPLPTPEFMRLWMVLAFQAMLNIARALILYMHRPHGLIVVIEGVVCLSLIDDSVLSAQSASIGVPDIQKFVDLIILVTVVRVLILYVWRERTKVST